MVRQAIAAPVAMGARSRSTDRAPMNVARESGARSEFRSSRRGNGVFSGPHRLSRLFLPVSFGGFDRLNSSIANFIGFAARNAMSTCNELLLFGWQDARTLRDDAMNSQAKPSIVLRIDDHTLAGHEAAVESGALCTSPFEVDHFVHGEFPHRWCLRTPADV